MKLLSGNIFKTLTVFISLVAGVASVQFARAEHVLQTLYEFFPTNSQPSTPTPLIEGQDGNFYGMTRRGGTNTFGDPIGKGTIFRMSSHGNVTTLFSFNQTNGASPFGALAQDSDGILYGTTTLMP